jgi:hypothetical protein
MLLDWATEEFGGASLADPRQVRSLTKIAAALAAKPQASLTSVCGPALRQAAHRVFEHKGTTIKGLLAGHHRATALRCSEEEFILIAQDTTFFVYGQAQITGLASLNASETSKGLIAHSALAMTESGTPLGLLHVDIWGCDESLPPRRPGKRAPLKERESYKWIAALESIQTRLPERTRALLIQDREADYFEFLAAPRLDRLHLLVRASHDRRVRFTQAATLSEDGTGEGETVAQGKLFAVAAAPPLLGEMAVMVPRRSGKGGQPGVPAREAQLELRARPLMLLRPADTESRQESVEVWVVEAREVDAPEAETAIRWVLLSTLPVTTLAEAVERVTQYSRRWTIERLHYTLKSGMNAERLQVDDSISLANVLAVYYPVAYGLLHLTYVAREHPDRPADGVLDPDEVHVLSRMSGRQINTASEAVLAVAKLGGYEYYRNAPPPGVKVLWLGWAQLRMLVIGWRLGRSEAP